MNAISLRCALPLLALGLFACGTDTRAQETPLGELIRQAEELFEADKFLRADSVYREALKVATLRRSAADRRLCFERLLVVSIRLGREDQAIGAGLEYADWLRQLDDAERLRELQLDLGRWYYHLGHSRTAEPHLRRALEDIRGVPLAPPRKLSALTHLALAAEKQGELGRARDAWKAVESFALDRLEGPRRENDPAVRVECVQRLADSYRFQRLPEAGIRWLEPLLPTLDQRQDWPVRRDVLRQLAGHLADDKRHGDAEKRLREALELHQKAAPTDRLTRADLLTELAAAVKLQGQRADADKLRHQAIEEFRTLLNDARVERSVVIAALTAFWKLQQIHQRANEHKPALQLVQDQSEHWDGTVVAPRLHAHSGQLHILLGKYEKARELLSDVVGQLEKQQPHNLNALAPALLNLGNAELATGGRKRAEQAGLSCLELYAQHQLKDDLVLIETYNLLGTCLAQDGNYASAIGHFRDGISRCKKLGKSAASHQCNLLLNIALLYKLQDFADRALETCREARLVCEDYAEPDALVFTALDAATATLLATQLRLDRAYSLTEGIIGGARRHNEDKGPLMIAARHCQALYHLSRRSYPEAETAWQEVKTLHGPRSPLMPRTLNYLALTRELQGRHNDASVLYEEARKLQQNAPLAFPVTHFTSLWRLATLHERGGKAKEARALLEEAVGVVEKARLRTYGDSQQRVRFFAQFEPGFEQLVGLCVRDGDVPGAIAAIGRGRSRTLLDQLLLANVDPRKSLQKEGDKQLLVREDELLRQIASLRSRIPLLAPQSAETEESRKLRAELQAAQDEYTRIYGEILNAAPVYHSLARQEFTAAELEKLRARSLGPKKLLLVYHIGRSQSHLLLLGDRMKSAEAYTLTVPLEMAARIALKPGPDRGLAYQWRDSAATVALLGAPLGRGPMLTASTLLSERVTRGIGFRPEREQPELPRQPVAVEKRGPLGREVLRALVEEYVAQIQSRYFRPSRGVALRPENPDRPLPIQRPDFLGDILLPSAARERIKELAPESLVVVPDGALHMLPFEALLLRTGDQSAYVLDELPPIVYAPSVAILAHLAERKPAAPNGPRSLLSVADPLNRQAPPLRYADKESDRVSSFFDSDQVFKLQGARATKKALVEALAGRDVVHIAAHGIALPSAGNQFGGLLLTPPQGEAVTTDYGFLALHEIHTLKLERCELAVLSACETNVGPQAQLEAGVTLAGSFLTAGARRVVASHWKVDDESTAELMAVFFEQVRAAVKADKPVAYARALQAARRQVRQLESKGLSLASPLYWAPFVLVGPAD